MLNNILEIHSEQLDFPSQISVFDKYFLIIDDFLSDLNLL